MGKKIGWIGCGKMGSLMAMNLLKAGNDLTVFDIVKANTEELAANGAHTASSPKDVAFAADYIFLSLPNGKILKAVICDAQTGVACGLSSNKIVIDTSTVAPSESLAACEAIEAKSASFLRAPVTGSTALAKSADLGVFSSGDKAAYDEILPLFQQISSNQHYLGDGEQARVLKLAINLMIAVNMQMLGESLSLIEKSGIDRSQAMGIICKSAAGSPVINYKSGNLVNHDFTPAFTVSMMEKDMDLLLDAAKEYKIALPTASLTRQFLSVVHGEGKENSDFSCLADFWCRLANEQ